MKDIMIMMERYNIILREVFYIQMLQNYRRAIIIEDIR